MNRSDRLDRIKVLQTMFRAAKASVDHFHRASLSNPTLIHGYDLQVREIRDCAIGLEDTYLVRAFAEFEIALRDYWENGGRKRDTHPPVKQLINSLGSKFSVRYDNLQNVHSIRDYRNGLMHGGDNPPKVTLADAIIYLCGFLYQLPWAW